MINDPERIKWFLQFSCVIVHNLRDKELELLAKFLFANHIPLFSITTNGLLASLRVQAPELCSMSTLLPCLADRLVIDRVAE
jgi:molybdopterin/thiamine biosynthesis adenylyltransferase